MKVITQTAYKDELTRAKFYSYYLENATTQIHKFLCQRQIKWPFFPPIIYELWISLINQKVAQNLFENYPKCENNQSNTLTHFRPLSIPSKNIRKPEVFREYRKRTAAWSEKSKHGYEYRQLT